MEPRRASPYLLSIVSLATPLPNERHTDGLPALGRLFTSLIMHISAYSAPNSRGAVSEHELRSHTILLPLSGVRHVEGGGQAGLADASTILLLNADVKYRFTELQGSGEKGHVIVLRPDILFRILGPGTDLSRPFPALCVPVAPRNFLLKQLLMEYLERGRSYASADVEALVLQFLTRSLARSDSWPRRSAALDATTESHRDCVDKVRILLNEGISDPVRLKDLSDAVGVSPFHLCRIFKAHTGLSIHRYLNQIRLRAALERVAEPSINLMNLALDLGFSSHSHFSFLFGREFGLSPTAFKKAVLQNDLRQATYSVTSRDLLLAARVERLQPSAPAQPVDYLAE
jgi:AraC family transcriptional regulator